MKDTAERRMMILERLCERRHDYICNLATEFQVSYGTIRRDLRILSCSYPIYTTQGYPGGVHIMEGYHLGMKYLTESQAILLKTLSENLTGEELLTMQSILKTFSKPIQKIG